MTRPAVVAHRGYAGVAPENTVRAVERAAADDRTAMIEIDVRPAACGTPVVVHDERLDGTRDGRPLTDAAGLVRETPLEALRSARVLGTDATIPTLAALLAAVPETVGVNVELKSPGTDDLRPDESLPADDRDRRRAVWRPFVERVVADCEAFGGELLFSSFCEGAIAALSEVADYAAAPIFTVPAVGLEIARRYDCEAVHPSRTAVAGPAADGAASDVVGTAHEAGRTVNAWTVTNWVQFDRLAAAGVDGVVAEYPGLDAVSSDR
jgi:glycerophosphoryl diester phosphodiesterase